MASLKLKVFGIFGVKPEEVGILLWSFLYFFSLLAAYFILRPVRENMGLIGGIENLPWLFTGTFSAMLLLSPIYAWLASRFPKRVFLPVVYGFFILNIFLFWVLFSLPDTLVYAARAFFIWISVFNLFVVSVFWSFMVNIFSKGQGKRLFGIISAGGTLGTFAGSGVTVTLAEWIGANNLLLVSMTFLFLALVSILKLLPLARVQTAKRKLAFSEVVGGGFYSGFRDTFTNPYLLGISLFIGFFSLTSTVLYFQQAEIVSNLFETSEDRTQVFALINLLVSSLTIFTQVFVTGRFVRKFGVTSALVFLPVITLIGFILFSYLPTLAVLVGFQALRRTSNFAISRPAREMLFSIVTEDQKYKAKNVIDTVVYRGSDALSGWIYSGLATGLGLGIPAIAAIAVPVAIIWIGLGWLLGGKYSGPVTKKPQLSGEKA